MRLPHLLGTPRPRHEAHRVSHDDALAQLQACMLNRGNLADAMQQCTAHELAALMASPQAVRTLAEQAVRYDDPNALMALQQAEAAATRKPWLSTARASRLRRQAIGQGGARSAVAAVHLEELGVDAFCAQFPNAQEAWCCLVEKRLLAPTRFVAHFGWHDKVIARWHAARVLPDASLTGWARDSPERMAQSIKSRACSPESLVACTPRAQRAALVTTLLGQGARFEQSLPSLMLGSEAMTWQAFQAGALDADAYVAAVGEVPAHRRDAFKRRTEPDDLTLLLRARCLDDAVIITQLQQGAWSATYILNHGPCSDAVVDACMRLQPMPKRALAKASVRFWHPHLALPLHHRQLAQQAGDMVTLVALMPRHPDTQSHRAYLLRMAAAFAEAQLVQRQGLARAPTDAPAQGSRACLVCLTPFDADFVRPTLRDCTHPQDVCLPCNKALFVRTPEAFSCITKSCRRPLNPDDGLAMGLDPHRTAWHLVQRWRRTQPQHLPCVRTSCVGGDDFDVNAKSCPVCTTPLPLPAADTYNVQKAYLTRLVTSLGMPHDTQVLVRECYHCGVATERGEGCAHLRCRECEGHWHFSRGAMPVVERRDANLKEGMQSYVPHKSLLVRLGFYAGATPGDTNVAGLAAQLQARLKAYTPEVHQAALARAAMRPAIRAAAP